MSDKIKLMFISIGYFPFSTSGEKNFFYGLSSLIIREIDSIVFLSINDCPEEISIQRNGEIEIPIFNLKRAFHFSRENKHLKVIGNNHFYHHLHSPFREISERFLTLLFSLPKIRQIIRKYEINIIHFTDNFGPAMWLIKFSFPKLKICYSPANYEPRRKFYDFYLRSSFSVLDKIFPLTFAYRNKLIEIGLDEKKINVIRWGIKFPDNVSTEEKEKIRRNLGYQPDDKLFLWTGYIQQINEKDFYQSIQIAKKIVRNMKNTKFLFCFKPECYQDKYKIEENEGIKVLTNLTNFWQILASADFLFSPIGQVNSTISPPLTWIEAMSLGTPVITTKVGGIDEVILDNKNGFVSDSYDTLYETLVEILRGEDLSLISVKARDFVYQNYNLEQIARKYIDSWKGLLVNEK